MSQSSLHETRPAHQSLYVVKIPTTFLLTNSVVLAGLDVSDQNHSTKRVCISISSSSAFWNVIKVRDVEFAHCAFGGIAISSLFRDIRRASSDEMFAL